jgi:glycosyltransferase involved in cell wall biosynthesis
MFINYYIPSKGGMETSVINLTSGLRAAGHEVFIFAPNYPNWQETDKNVYRYKSFYFTYDDYLYTIPIPHISKMDDVVQSLHLDIIHSHQPFSLGWEATKFGRKLGIPVVLTYHIKYTDYYHYVIFLPKKISQRIIRYIVNRNCRKCDAVIAPSSAIKKLLFDDGIKKSVHIIPSGINIDQFAKDMGTRANVRSKYDVKDNEILLITASRVVPEKNIDFLVRSFAIIRRTRKDVKLMIVGEGSFRDELEKLVGELGIGESVIFTGLLDKDGMIAHYQASDIFVFASLTETQGLVAVEAMAAGLPVVAVKASGIEDMIKSGQDGILTDNTEENFAANAVKLIEDGELRKKMSAAARVNAQNFRIEPWTEKVVALYKELIRKKEQE